MKNNYLLYLLLSLLIASCSPDDSDSGASNGTDIMLLKTLTQSSNGSLRYVHTYEYDDQNRLTKVVIDDQFTIKTITYTYTENRLEEMMINYTSFDDEITETRTFEYQGDNIVNVCKINEQYDPDWDETDISYGRIGYDFNNANLVSTLTHYESIYRDEGCSAIQGVNFDEKFEYDTAGNMIRWEAETFFGGNSYFTYEYDTNAHPESGSSYVPYKKTLGYSVINNIIAAKKYGVETGELQATIDYEYDYNENGYPTKLLRKYRSGDTTTFTQETEWTYEYY